MNTPIAPPRPAAGRHFRLGAAGVLALLLSTLAAGARAQSQPRLAFERIAQERGLSNGTVTAIVQGRAGFLWIGTEDGLNRYDGSGFILYRPMAGDTTSLADAWVTAIAPSRTGTPWVATLRGGVHRLLPRSTGFLRYRHTPGDSTSLSSNQVNAVLEARDGALWAGTVRGLDRLDPATGRVRRYAPVPGDSGDLANDVLSLAEEPSGALWVGTRQGLFAFDPARGRFDRVELALRTRVVRTLLRDRRGSLWVGTEDELVALDAAMRALRARWRESAPARHVPFSGRVMALHEGPDGTIWIGSDGGLAALDPATGTFARHRYDPRDPRSLGGKIVRSVLVDRGGVLWAGLESYGLSKHAPAVVRFDVIRHDPASPSSLSDGYIRGITEDRRGNLWIGTQFGGLDRRDARTGRITAYRHRPGDPRSLPGDEVWAVLEDRAGTMWVGLHQRGLGTFDPRTGTFARSPLVPDDASVNLVYEDRAGTLLVGLEGRGLIELSPDRRSARRYGATTGERRVLAHDDVQAILEDREGMLWVGGAGGLTRLDRRTGCATQFRGAPGRPGALAADFITNIVEDRAGTLWVATKGGGLSRFDRRTERFTTFGVADGLPHSFVYGVLEDARGNLWLSTDDGIAMLDPRTRLVTRYTLADGLQAREFNRRAFHRGRDGTMYFGGIAGVNVFRPDEAADAPPPPPVSLVSLRVGDAPAQLAVSLTPDSVVRLRHDQNAFALSFAALDFTAPEKSEFAYRLEGADRAWVRAGTRRDAAYAGVPPGRYVFRVTAASAAGVWNPASAGVTIEIAPPWWGTWWARVLAGLLLVGIPIAAIRARLRAVRRRSALLERMVDEQTRGLTETQARLREALEREREAARELLDITATMPGAVFQLREAPDGGRTLPFVSEGIVEICRDGALAPDDGEDPRQLAEWLLTRIFPEELESARRARAASRDAMAPWEAQLRWSPADGGEPRWLAVRARPSRHLDGATVWSGVIMDATAERRAAVERAALEAKMLQAQKAESLGILAGGIAHDFNNLLVGMLANADLLRREVAPGGEAAEMIGAIRGAARRAAELTHQMLAYAGRGRLVVEQVDVAQLVREMLALLRSAVPRTIAFDFHAAPAPAPVEADATQLRQVVMNLITNAAEAIGDGAGHVVVRVGTETAPQRELRLLHAAPDMPASGPYVVLEVTDDGCGMDPSLLGRIFDPFYTTKFTGRGLGLAAMLGIVRAHRGGVQVLTTPGRGTRFLVYLPLAGSDAREPRPAAAAPEAPAAAVRSRVLVVDDEEAVRLSLARILRKRGYEVVLADDGPAALDAARGEGAFDIILMDVTMPIMDGPAAARALRASGVDAPIILMSGYAEEELSRRGIMTHADAFLGKPFDIGALTALLREVAAPVRG